MDQATNQATTEVSFVSATYIQGLVRNIEEYLRTLKSK